jgi:hypothetical protein
MYMIYVKSKLVETKITHGIVRKPSLAFSLVARIGIELGTN